MIAATSTLAEQRNFLENISWQTFETLLKEIGDNRGYRIAYDDGMLEIITPSGSKTITVQPPNRRRQ